MSNEPKYRITPGTDPVTSEEAAAMLPKLFLICTVGLGSMFNIQCAINPEAYHYHKFFNHINLYFLILFVISLTLYKVKKRNYIIALVVIGLILTFLAAISAIHDTPAIPGRFDSFF